MGTDFKVKYSRRNGEMRKERNTAKGSELFKEFMCYLGPSVQLCLCRKMEHWQISALLHPSCHRAGSTGSRGSIAGANREEQKWIVLGTRLPAGRGDWDKGMFGVKYLPSAFCSQHVFFIYFYTLKQYLHNKQSGYGRIDLGNNWKICSPSNLTLNPKKRDFYWPHLNLVFWRTLPPDTPICGLWWSQFLSVDLSV